MTRNSHRYRGRWKRKKPPPSIWTMLFTTLWRLWVLTQRRLRAGTISPSYFRKAINLPMQSSSCLRSFLSRIKTRSCLLKEGCFISLLSNMIWRLKTLIKLLRLTLSSQSRTSTRRTACYFVSKLKRQRFSSILANSARRASILQASKTALQTAYASPSSLLENLRTLSRL